MIHMKCLVTGGAGFIGSHLASALSGKGEVTVLDDLSEGKAENLSGLPRVSLAKQSVTNAKAVEKAARGAEVIFHLAAIVGVRVSFEDPQKTIKVNVEGVLNVLEAARKNDARVVYTSSAAVYGNAKPPLREDLVLDPQSPYATSKLMGESYIQIYQQAYGLKAVVLRHFNVFGPRQPPESHYAAAVPRFARALLEGKRPTVFGDGEQTRDFIYVGDVARAYLLAAEKDKAVGGTFNIGSGKGVSVNHLIELLEGITGRKADPVHEPAREGEIRHSWADISRAREVLGFQPEISLKEGLRETVEWLRAQLTAKKG